MSEIYTLNRKNFADQMKDGSVVVLFAGVAPVKRGDEFYPFAPQRNFFYMTGLQSPNLIFTMTKDDKGEIKSKIYLERYDEETAKWDGDVLSKEKAEKISGIDTFGFIDEFKKVLPLAFLKGGIKKIYIDMENRSFDVPNTPDLDFALLMREKFPFVKIKNSHTKFGKLRLIKTDPEVQDHIKASKVTNQAFEALLRNVKPGMTENQLEAHIDYTFKFNGSGHAFRTIMASGKNACILHYNDNNCVIGDNELILVDFGAQYNWHSCDVSRTFPANGKFTERQKQLYNIVLGGMKHVFSIVKPGLVFKELQESLIQYYLEELFSIGLLKEKTKDELKKYYYHGVSHMLGLETHDVGSQGDLVLKEGMLFTVEPGLYIAKEGIGIRIEDDILVTKDGYKNLTDNIIKEVDEIEAFMAK